jgi:hypothetical protein
MSYVCSSAEGVRELEITQFSSVALPFPKCREADTARSDGSIFASDVEVARFDTPSAESGRECICAPELTIILHKRNLTFGTLPA